MNPNKLIFFFILTFLFSFNSIAQDLGYTEVQLTHNTFDDRYASYNKEGTLIIFESNRDGHWQIYSMDINGNHQKRIIRSKANDRRPTWHPSKNIILFESDRSGRSEIYSYNLSTRIMSKIPIPLKGNKSFAQFAPNGTELVFNYKINDNNFNIYIISAKGKRLKTIIKNSHKNMYPHYSPRGDAIVYFSRKHTKDKDDEIYAYNIINKDEARLTNSPTHNFCPVWSHNEKRIVYVTSMEGSEPEIYIMNKDGKSKQRITFNDFGDTLPTWSPKDINLLITGYRNGSYQICKILLKEPIGASPKLFIED
ncbi:MAG: PD40 domain-containing protein [Bacteroidetes bacterium]|nr:PD40 domain-containing protein [Bacteroidota bacterium]